MVFFACFTFLDEILEQWSHLPAETRRESTERMKVCAFWLPILLQRDESSRILHWALQIGLIDSK